MVDQIAKLADLDPFRITFKPSILATALCSSLLEKGRDNSGGQRSSGVMSSQTEGLGGLLPCSCETPDASCIAQCF